ncbi:RHS repeat-associated core domain-containing protein [Sorangium sp. So ce542]|uniref:RHS repeat-associated core domain-containing protein n=1 Tax=Sorangium sp. So ce542 TaxID=3133316 RepID=UPI003F63753C
MKTAGADVFAYDAVGNQIRRPGVEAIRYTAFDLPASITLAGGAGTVDLDYDGDQRRIRKTTPAEQTVYAGDLYERVTDLATGAVEHRYTVRSSERAVAVVTKRAGEEARTLYIHVDHLGSVDLLTEGRGEDAGKEVERRSYDAFGARRDPVTWRRAPAAEALPALLARGFTGHGSDDELGLVHMKGRLYDPKIGRFTTPDPVVSRPLFGQSWNAYSYVLNNPLAYVDPSGFQEAVPEDRGGSSRAAGAEFTSDELGLPPIEELVVARFPEHEARSDADANATGAEIGGAVPPVDVGVYGTSAGFVPQPAPSSPEHASAASVVGEGLLGAGEGTGELALGVARSLVLSALTFGGLRHVRARPGRVGRVQGGRRRRRAERRQPALPDRAGSGGHGARHRSGRLPRCRRGGGEDGHPRRGHSVRRGERAGHARRGIRGCGGNGKGGSVRFWAAPACRGCEIYRRGHIKFVDTLSSGAMTTEEAALGFPRSSLATHTEARAARIPLQAGDTMIIQGQYPPCPSCKGAMKNAASSSGAEIHYLWKDQHWTAGGQ